jgi:alkylation response protein AidB-like acyl-CoA dehydrogenase
MVEKIKRDVRITTIYEGTSEIMEMTIGRDRWQQHLKSSGRHYHDQAEALEALQQTAPQSGAAVAALAHHALAEIMEACRVSRLTRNQHVLLRLGEWVAWTECAAAFARRAVSAAGGVLPPKSDRRFDASALAAMSRVFARDAALKVTTEGLRWVHGAGPDVDADLAGAGGLADVLAAQSGLIEDMDAVAAAIYGRTS